MGDFILISGLGIQPIKMPQMITDIFRFQISSPCILIKLYNTLKALLLVVMASTIVKAYGGLSVALAG